ncbi:MAG TPA: peptidase M4 family protein [Herpetosiphon sp.]|uniref:Neutral metalloproteinase n=1 Tax=Herpetosiphon aurantiacus (strain ATCC 23779 / DSM 785 / 114-95) TaxID=316274 RepID=A9B670_HERA2|nr:M4 family metallopeptidase [Herpetosiphon sp.]ABX06281.1 Thermolysin [Herpetosiphon aurantiacus DSM 785]HBW48861.1 peptidase M4 family protein [Herpetosiphon sp.]
MVRKRLITVAALLGLVGAVFGSAVSTGAQDYDKVRGQLIRTYREAEAKGVRPDWVTAAVDTSLNHFAGKGANSANLQVRGVDQDDLGINVRLDQTYAGLPVFGGQVIAHLDNKGNVTQESGELFAVDGIDTSASLSSAEAIKIAQSQVKYDFNAKNASGTEVSSELKILPREGKDSVIVFQVSLHIEDGSEATAHHEFFINAKTGETELYYNDMDGVNATGTGKSLYSGNVSITTDLVSGVYYLRDNSRGGMYTTNMNNRTTGGSTFTDADNVWGTNTTANVQSAGVDAHYGAQLTWDYYLSSFGRRGIDGNGFRVLSRVHYGNRYNNAFWNGSSMTYGDGDGTTFRPLVSLDVAGHEITHGLTEKTAGLIYSNESGAANESFSDIFGTMVEYSSGTGDYLIGEDIYTPATAGDALRNMSNPAAEGDPDHYSKRYTGTGDNGGVHINSGIQNQVFYLLAQGGTNRTSGLAVTGIGRPKAAAIFYRALTVYLTPSSNFKAVRTATLNAARDLYGASSAEYNATAQAWTACGVQ